VLAMFDPWHYFFFSCSITYEFIGDDNPWDIFQAFEQLPRELLGGLAIAALLSQNV
jgi:hypothetical protein